MGATVPVVHGGYDVKCNYYKELVSAGREGLILKLEDAVYHPYEARGGMSAGFVKWKRNTSECMLSCGSFFPSLFMKRSEVYGCKSLLLVGES